MRKVTLKSGVGTTEEKKSQKEARLDRVLPAPWTIVFSADLINARIINTNKVLGAFVQGISKNMNS